ncbi:hypothetical protein [Streptomyces tsukubensis]|uniref:Uncharacterized protein n=1 Tax=Streptomyces tsukubensis TaxID=83656 RepID=A0A1V4AD70_9ACTN|nr:hypothetical protein [Streptomyces tsukubensis]OON81710.1 hypothetical protein B1H18_06085 [Streptomyces tsukubensis]QFR96488.1 hypothetical protein GBW32_29925 [Streptomyces tsukubensis]
MTHLAPTGAVPGLDWLLLIAALLATAVTCVAVPVRIEMSRGKQGKRAEPHEGARTGPPAVSHATPYEG